MTDTQKITRLERQLADSDRDSAGHISQKIDVMNELAWLLSDVDHKRAQTLSEKAYALAESTKDGAIPYKQGMACSLRTQGYLNLRLGDYPLGMTQLLEAQEMCESLQLNDALVDVLDGIAGIYYQIGNFPEMLKYSYKQLEAAQLIDDKRRVANAYNNLAHIYFETGDYDRAIETLHQNLQLAVEIDYKRIEALSYLNLSETYLLAGNDQQALENAQQALTVSRAAGFELFEVYAFDFAGKAYLKLDEPARAIGYFEDALALSLKIESKVTESLILLNIGQAYHANQQPDPALNYLNQAIATARAINANGELFKGHLLLSEIYEQQGDLARALHHFKQHYIFKELVFGEKADQRLKVLQIAHDTATAKHEAEIHKLQNVELKREIAERRRREERLRLLESVVKHTSDGVLVTEAAPLDPPGPRIVYANQALVAITGYTREELLGQNPRILQGPKTDRLALDRVRDALIYNQPVTVELINYTKTGQEFWIELSMSPVADQTGHVTHFVAIQREITDRKQIEAHLQRQLDYTHALSACSQTLLAASGSRADNRLVLTNALSHLVEPTRASKVYIYENFNDPEMGFCSRLVVDACASGIPSLSSDPDSDPNSVVIPWSIIPDENRRRLESGRPVGGPVKTLFAGTPSFRDYLLNQAGVLSTQFFPIHFGNFWWGYVGFDDRATERTWGQEETLLLRTVAEMLSSTLQRWQTEEELRKSNDQLEQQVIIRTSELSDTITLLQQEIIERERAEAETRQLLDSLEQRVAIRTEELATFFDLTVLAGQAANLDDVFQQATLRILEITRSRAICIHLLETNLPGLHLAAQQNLPAGLRPGLQTIELPPDFSQWLQQPADPLVTTSLSSLAILPPPFRLKEFRSYLGAQIKVGQQVKGLLSCYRFTERGYSLDEISLVAALAEQIGMVLETHRLRQTAREVAVLEERQRLARDLHDSVTQSIYSLTLFARSSREAAEDGDMALLNSNLLDIENSALHTLQEMRLLLYELRAPLLEHEGLAQALDTRLNLVERRTNVQVNYQVNLPLPELPYAVELELYRLAIEAFNNIAKHAGAQNIAVDLQATNNQVYLKIADDGCGFDRQQLAGGFGLQNMQERVDRLGGTLTIVSAPGQGTEISVRAGLADG